jgi:prephenate dehydrogenase
LAAVSHLPHVLSFALVDMLVHSKDHQKVMDYAAGGFRDFTRIAASDPVMWRDICLANKTQIMDLLVQYQHKISSVITLLEQDKGDELEQIFQSAKDARNQCQC